jgi:arylsulfatase A-like enzyme
LHGSKSYLWEGGHRVPFIAHWGDGTAAGSQVPPGTVRQQVVGTHDIVPTFAELAGAKLGPDQALDSVSFASVLRGKRGDDQPVRQTLLIQSSPGRDAFTEGITADGKSRAEAQPKGPAAKKAKKQQQRKAAQAGAGTGSDGMAHALREGPWKLVLDIQDRPAALYNLAADLAELKNLIKEPAQAERVRRMEKLYRGIRASKRSTPAMGT